MTRASTRAEVAFLDLRRDILAGRLLPGQRLQFSDLSVRYVTSVGVLREALSRLVEQGLVISEPQQGFRVVPVSPDDLVDLTAARVEIETMTLRRALAAGDLAWESRLVAAHHILDGTPQLDPADPRRVNEAWAAAHAHFHEVLLEACPIRRLREMANSLRDAAELYRRWSRHLGGERQRDIPGEHRGLLDAALRRDVDGAIALLTQHIEYTTKAVLATGRLSADTDATAEAPDHPRQRTSDGPARRPQKRVAAAKRR
jgi:DNA-binding GntR family transcriptional regulator